MDHSAMGHGSTNTAAPFDAQFIDGMIIHHQGAIVMAKQALERASRPEIKTLAQNIITAQESEIARMREWRRGWYPDVPETQGTGMEMGPMEVPEGDGPFDLRFIDAMIPHHEGAIAVSKEAIAKAARPEVKQLAEEIIKAQTTEIEQMRQWRSEWFQ
jgi:uncharacterized protein (DUF305 family)